MATSIIFACPACGNHELMRIEQAVLRTPVALSSGTDTPWVALPSGPVQELKGRTLGYRCARCRYPDVPNHEDADGFYWQSLEQVAAAGVLSLPESEGAQPARVFMICQPDGITRRITHVPPHSGLLSITERAAILSAHGAPAGSVLLTAEEGK